MDSTTFFGPVNIGSEEMVASDEYGVRRGRRTEQRSENRGRNSDNRLIKEKIGWAPDLYFLVLRDAEVFH